MIRPIVIGLLFLFPLSSWAQDKPCSENPKTIGKPFVVHGRLSAYSGAPLVRLWDISTHRSLGVSEGRFYVKGYRNLPKFLEKKLNWDTVLYGEFAVYAFTRSQPGVMQLICVESVKNLVIKRAR